jgi:hypothetical protein
MYEKKKEFIFMPVQIVQLTWSILSKRHFVSQLKAHIAYTVSLVDQLKKEWSDFLLFMTYELYKKKHCFDFDIS